MSKLFRMGNLDVICRLRVGAGVWVLFVFFSMEAGVCCALCRCWFLHFSGRSLAGAVLSLHVEMIIQIQK